MSPGVTARTTSKLTGFGGAINTPRQENSAWTGLGKWRRAFRWRVKYARIRSTEKPALVDRDLRPTRARSIRARTARAQRSGLNPTEDSRWQRQTAAS